MKLPFLWWLRDACIDVGSVPEITPEELERWLQTERPLQLVDARTGLEYQQGTIRDALHAPVTGMPGSLADLQLDADSPVIMLCLSGHRSRPGVRWLRGRGIEAYSLKGGILAWRQAGFPLNPPK